MIYPQSSNPNRQIYNLCKNAALYAQIFFSDQLRWCVLFSEGHTLLYVRENDQV